MIDHRPEKVEAAALIKVLAAHYRALATARCDESILREYQSLLQILRKRPIRLWGEPVSPKAGRPAGTRMLPTIKEEELRQASLDDLERMIGDAKTARKNLEFIAVRRFNVPRGSMRQYANREMLLNKLRTLIGNERAHQTISSVAREQGKRP